MTDRELLEEALTALDLIKVEAHFARLAAIAKDPYDHLRIRALDIENRAANTHQQIKERLVKP